jgi:hypothetical protein
MAGKKMFWNSILACVLLRKSFWNGVLACSVTKIPLDVTEWDCWLQQYGTSVHTTYSRMAMLEEFFGNYAILKNFQPSQPMYGLVFPFEAISKLMYKGTLLKKLQQNSKRWTLSTPETH